MITQLKLDESTKLEFGVQITGADALPSARFIIEHKEFSIMLPCKQVNEGMEVEIPALKKFFTAGEYQVRLEVVLDNKLYTPLTESIVFEPSIEVASKSKPVTQVKESVKIAKVTVKKSDINEHLLRKTQAATIIAQSLGYVPETTESPVEVIENAILSAGVLSKDQALTLSDMLDLAAGTGVNIDRSIIKEAKDTEVSDEELDDVASALSDDEIEDDYEDEEFAVVDDATGEQLEESFEINEVLSRVERNRARIRMARTKTKREVKARIALKKHSSGAVLQKRARRLAVKAIEKKLAHRNLDTLSVADKERIERIIARKSKIIDRLALKMLPRVRNIEKTRLAHHSFTKH